MKKNSVLITSALLLCISLAGVTASAKVKSRTVAITQDFAVAGTVVKSGIYLFSFDDKTNELTISDNKTRSVVAKVAARTQPRETAAPTTDLQLARQGDSMVLTGVAFSGEKWDISVNQETAGN
ncbi:MAG TPA: hypothetical protein VN228_20045 [Pyrinomonadaceae bacterium]|nr:hypothetical protein [Pyrinomonadaceae bacterium]